MKNTQEDIKTLKWSKEILASLKPGVKHLCFNFEYAGEKVVELMGALEKVDKIITKIIEKEEAYVKCNARAVADDQSEG